jgi:hypothetical protein
MDDKGHAGLYNLSAHYEQTVNRGAIEIVVPFFRRATVSCQKALTPVSGDRFPAGRIYRFTCRIMFVDRSTIGSTLSALSGNEVIEGWHALTKSPDIQPWCEINARRPIGDETGEEPANTRQSGDDLLDHAIGEIFLLRVAAHVLKRQHRNRMQYPKLSMLLTATSRTSRSSSTTRMVAPLWTVADGVSRSRAVAEGRRARQINVDRCAATDVAVALLRTSSR